MPGPRGPAQRVHRFAAPAPSANLLSSGFYVRLPGLPRPWRACEDDSSRGPPPRSASVQNNPTGLFWPRLRGFWAPGAQKRGAQAPVFPDVRFLAGPNDGLLLITTCGSVRTGPATGRSSSQTVIEPYGFVSHWEARDSELGRFGLVAQIRGCGIPQPSYPATVRPAT